MSSITDDEIRVRILQILTEEAKKGSLIWGVHRSTVLEVMNIPDRNLDYNVSYLAKNGMVKLVKAHIGEWVWAAITSVGRDVLENPTRYEERFPFTKMVSQMKK
jgi:hypothetical protein